MTHENENLYIPEQLNHDQGVLLMTTLRSMLIADGVISQEAVVSGPELVAAATCYVDSMKKEPTNEG